MDYIDRIYDEDEGKEFAIRGTAHVQSEEPVDAPEGALWYDPDDTVPETVSLPSVSTADNGKFLRVVDGAWAAVTVDSAEGVSF